MHTYLYINLFCWTVEPEKLHDVNTVFTMLNHHDVVSTLVSACDCWGGWGSFSKTSRRHVKTYACLNARERLWLLRRVGQLLKNFKKTCKDMCMSQRSWALVILGRPVEESGSIWPTPLISQERLWILRAHCVPCMFFKKRLRDSTLAFTRGWTRGWVLESH